jgi:hypothetical protein
MNFQRYLENTYRIIKAEPLILILGGLLIQLLNSVTLSFLCGPLFGGYMLMVILLLRDGKKPKFNDLFNGFQFIRLLFPYFFILLAKVIGFMLFVVPGVLFATWWIYVLPLMVDRKIGFGEAMRISSDKVTGTGFFMHMVFFLLVYVIPMILIEILVSAMPFLMVISLLLLPFQAGCLAGLYLDQFNEIEPRVKEDRREGLTEESQVILSSSEESGDQRPISEKNGQTDEPDPAQQEPADQPDAELLTEDTLQEVKPDQGAESQPDQAEKDPAPGHKKETNDSK